MRKIEDTGRLPLTVSYVVGILLEVSDRDACPANEGELA
jgi:hypothetical protein